MDLDLSTVRNALHDVRTKWFDIGVELKVKIPTLKSIETRYDDDKDCLREVITEWLNKANDQATWESLVDALRTRVIDEPRLAAELEAKYCSCPTESKARAKWKEAAAKVRGKTPPDFDFVETKPTEDKENIESLKLENQQLKKQLKENDQSWKQEIQLLKEQLKEKEQQIREKDNIIKAQERPVTLPKGIRGSAAVEGNIAYFRIGGDSYVYAYDSSNDKWLCIYPECPCIRFGIAVINDLLTTIGGQQDGKVIGSLLSLTGEGTNKQWSEKFNPMPTERLFPGIVRHRTMLIIAGGTSSGLDGDSLTTVEIMNTETRHWTTVRSLPHPFIDAWLTICGNHVYMLGGNIRKTPSKFVFSCSLSDLQDNKSGKWDTLPKVPVYNATCATVNGQLLAVGGKQSLEEGEKNCPVIYAYNPTEKSWAIKCNMKIARSFCLVAALPNDRLMVVGGFVQGPDMHDESTNDVEIIDI